MTAWFAVVLAAAAALVLVPPTSVTRIRRPTPTPRRRALPGLGRRSRTATDQAAVLEVCDLLAADLDAGRPPGSALASAAERWPALGPVVEALALGADVPEAFRRVAAERRGAADLHWVAGAWQVAQDSGHGLSAALGRTAAGLRARRRTRRLVDSELASARATARLVACLPVAVLLMGSGAGSDPWAFLLGSPVGVVCLVVGLGLLGLGLLWIERIADRAAAP